MLHALRNRAFSFIRTWHRGKGPERGFCYDFNFHPGDTNEPAD